MPQVPAELGGTPLAGNLEEILAGLQQQLPEPQGAPEQLTDPFQPFSEAAPMRGPLSFQGLLGAQGGAAGGFGSGGGSSGSGGFSGGSSGFTAAPSGPDFGGYDTSPNNLITRQDVTGIPEAVRRLMVAERRLGVPGLSENVVSDFRSHEQQAALYAQHLAGQHPAPVAPPGQSFHEQGEAFDISSAWLDANPPVRPWLEHHGFVFDVPGEPWHAHYVGGGEPLKAAVRALARPDEPSPVRPLGQPAGAPQPRRTQPAPTTSTRRPNAGITRRRP